MSIFDHKYRKVPDYYPTMYLDGFTPDEIHYAKKRQMMKDWEERELKKNLEKEFEKELEKALAQALDELLKDFK